MHGVRLCAQTLAPLYPPQTHPWFVTNLPPEAATMNDSYLRAAFPPGACQFFGVPVAWTQQKQLALAVGGGWRGLEGWGPKGMA